jgi:hypothetical protein
MKRFARYLSAALAVLFVTLTALPVSAAPASSSGLSITPKKSYIIQPGDTVNDTLQIGNLDSTSDLSLNLRMIDFTYTNQSGTPKLALAQNAPQMPWSLKPFTTIPKTVEIPAGGSKTVNFSVTIPKNLGAGSYYSAILYQAGGGNGGNVALNASGVSLIFVSVPGQVKENMALQKFGAYNSDDNGVSGGFVFIDVREQPKMIAYALKNAGNVFESPAGNVVVKDMFGHQIANVQTNATSSLALIGQTRLFTSCIKTVQQTVQALGGTSKNDNCVDPHLKPGRYTAHLDAFYGQNGNQSHEITATTSFWYLPFWFLATVVVILGLLIWAGFWLKKKIKGAVKGTTFRQGKGVSRKH